MIRDPYLKRLASDWIETFGKNENDAEEASVRNPFSAFQAIIKGDSVYAWSLILEVIEMDDNGQSLDLLAAAPLEDFLVRHGEAMIDYIEEDVLRNPRLRGLLAGVRRSRINDTVWDRLQRNRSE